MIHVGTSGFNYPEWRGRFYPADLPAAKMLPFYASRFGTVEINYSFYRVPTRRLLEGWAAQVPAGFTFSLKAPRRITHDRRLKECGDLVKGFCEVAATLQGRLGVLLFQLAPNFKCDLPVLDAFLDHLPPRARAAFEFRHASWWCDEVYDRLAQRNLALCIADEEDRHTPFVATADYGYLRLRDADYEPAALRAWADRVSGASSWGEAFVYFKHEDEARGPEFAASFLDLR
jgi:uncharacterized protein YecE (DUF72 family)